MLRQEVQDLHASLKVSISLKQGETFHFSFYLAGRNALYMSCFLHSLGGTMVLWRAEERIRQSPGTPEASNSFQMFHVLQQTVLDLGYQSKLLL